jgi:hypothetical protein
MTKIKDILTLDLHEDIKNVIDLEDRSENEIQNEIQNYIVTEGLARYLDTFLKEYTSNLKETGVWLSGFYGSGKSYFGKMLGYLLANPNINGTPARDRFIPRLKGVSNESFIENAIRSLDAINSRVIFLDVAKQNTDKGLAFTLFANLLKQLGFRDDIYGYMEWDLFLDGKLDQFKKAVNELEKEPWDEVKRSNRRVAKVMRAAYSKLGYSEVEYQDTRSVYSEAIENFSASKFREVLEHYLKQNSDETLVFIFDEASEAISQKKFSLLDLEGLSESLSSITSKVWTIAIAQEKLDDVISNANVNRSQLTKVTDRYKTKIHLESTEVDVIIRNRLLKKKSSAEKDLTEYYNKNQGQVTDATNLKSAFPTQTNNEAAFTAYYPFHKYQFDILQKFLFSSNALVATQIAARGMIITAFDVLRRQMKDGELFDFTPGHAICTEAQTAPPVALANKYDTAKQILANKNIPIAGDLLLKTIHLLVDSEVVYATVENITKSYISDISAYYNVKPDIEKALDLLVEAKVLLVSNHHYKITSDLEGKLLEEMRDYQVELFVKKRELTNLLKEYKLFYNVSTYSDGSDTFKFSVLTDQGDDLASQGSPDLRLTVYSLFNIGDNRQDHIEQVKMSTQAKKDEAILIPENKAFDEIDKLISEVKRYEYMEEKYSNEADQNKRQIIREFRVMREEKAKHLRRKVETAYQNGALVYLFSEQLLNEQKFKSEISDTQKKIIKNIYTKRIPSQLLESVIPKLFRAEKTMLASLFSGPEFTFFDKNGNFVGESLKVVDAIQTKINSQHVDGRSLEDMLKGAPWAYSFGTIVTTLAVLLRAGRLTVKYNGQPWYSHADKGVHEAFTNAVKFKSASFKSITASLSSTKKTEAIQLLLDLDIATYTGQKISWSSSDYDVAEGVRALAEHFRGAVDTLQNSIANFDAIFSNLVDQKQVLQAYTGKVTDSNFIQQVESMLLGKADYKTAIQSILQGLKFIKNNFATVSEYKAFAESVVNEMQKAGQADETIAQAAKDLAQLYSQDPVKNFSQIGQQKQIIKDAYFKTMKFAAEGMSSGFESLNKKVEIALKDLTKNYPADINATNNAKLEVLQSYCQKRTVGDPTIDTSVSCEKTGFSLSDILNYSQLLPMKETELQVIQSSFLKIAENTAAEPGHEQTEEANSGPRKISLQIPTKVLKVKDYRAILMRQITALASASDEDEIELDVDLP